MMTTIRTHDNSDDDDDDDDNDDDDFNRDDVYFQLS